MEGFGLASVKCDSYRNVTNDDGRNVTGCCWDLPNWTKKCESYNLDHDTLNALVKSGDEEYQHLQNATGHWTKRYDVDVELNGYSHSLSGVSNPLSVGLGIGNDRHAASGHTNFVFFGPELQFGHVVGDRIGKQVLILKYAVGGSSLYKSWRPPSAVERRPQGPQTCGLTCSGETCKGISAGNDLPKGNADLGPNPNPNPLTLTLTLL